MARIPSDSERVGTIWFDIETYRFYLEGIKGLRDHLSQFEEIKNLFGIQLSPYDRQMMRVNRMIEWADKRLQEATPEDPDIVEWDVTYGTLRLLKAGGLFRVRQIEKQREEVINKYPNMPRALLASIDEKMAQYRDKLEIGKMSGLPPADIFLEATQEGVETIDAIGVVGKPTDPKVITHVPPYLETIPLLDEELRARCLPLIALLDSEEVDSEDTEEGTKLDTVVREMSVILENRIRKLARLKEARLKGVKLMGRAFGGDKPLLRFSTEKDIQESAHLLYRGYSGFVRNEVMHSLIPTFTRERVLQLLGFVDYLLFILTQAKRPTKKRKKKSDGG
ncbi:TIGR02391 family protein [Nitrospinae bacterium AH_259_B05_G02_I21]|nr:TIGR02391 family protein [Nitrospinae bacterium AH_259_B05_G02_I21]MDA2932576.1 TIGR02391 family protein [Nitrospinae bacterium AH-259-F20]